MEVAGAAFRLGFAFVLVLSLLGEIFALIPAPTITAFDRNRYRTLFNDALNSNDLESVAYGARGFSALNERLSDVEKVCNLVKKNLNPIDVSSVYYAIAVIDKITVDGGSCQVSWGRAEETASSSTKAGASTRSLYHAVAALKHFGKPVPKEVASYLTSAIKEDDMPASYAYAFYAALYLPRENALKIHELVEDVTAQADEVGDQYYQYSDLVTTALVLDSAYSLSKAVKVQPAISEDKVVKFGNYLLNRKLVGNAAEASLILSALIGMTTNDFYIPIATSLEGPVSINDKSPNVVVKVCDLLGRPVPGVSVVADTGRHIAENAVILSKKPLVQSKVDSSLFELDLYGLKPAVGFYRLFLSSSPAPKGLKLLGSQEAEIIVKVTTAISVKDVEVSVIDREQGTVLKSIKVDHPNKISTEADFHQKFLVKFTVADKQTGSPISPHQTFVRLLNEKTQHEVIYVAEEDSSRTYKFDLDVGLKGKDFNGLSGKYSIDLIVGDAVIENPLSWSLGDVKLTFNDDVTPPQLAGQYEKKPEISHMFREPEKRPLTAVSNFFTVLVALPFLVLLVLWIKLGANVSNLPLSLSALGFHLGLGAIFGLYGMYFWKLNMFETLKYLGLIGLPTFVFGHRLLSYVASKRK